MTVKYVNYLVIFTGDPTYTATLASGDCLHTLRWQSTAVSDVSYSPCARFIVTATRWGGAG